MLPVVAAPLDTAERLLAESALCQSIGTLNPPRVYSLIPKRKQRSFPGVRIFDSRRPICRLRSSGSSSMLPLSSSLDLIRKEWRDGLKKTASALAGHLFVDSSCAALAAWNLSPGAWAFVARHIDQCECGWRRRRGLRILGLIAKKRRDLSPFVSSVAVTVPWVGSMAARRIICTAIRKLLASWRAQGCWVPVARHAKCFVSWSASPSVADLLSDPSPLRKALEDGIPPLCRCGEILSGSPCWPVVTFEGREHIAASQGAVPWPEQLQHLARWPATLSLPPRFDDIVAALRNSFRRLRSRCRISLSDPCTDVAVRDCAFQLWAILCKDSRVPITWDQATAARTWLRSHGFFVSIFDHNASSLGVFCPWLVFEHTCKLLDFLHHQNLHANFVWSCSVVDCNERDLLRSMAAVPLLPDYLSPHVHAVVSRKLWRIATVSVLPKWKCPGLKWRLIINKHFTPCCGLHSLVSRALDVLLDGLPVHLWSDYLSIGDVVPLVAAFNLHASDYQFTIGCAVAADMVDCFRHLPCEHFADMWDALAAYWDSRSISMVSIPPKRLGGRGILGRCDDPGWTCLDFPSIRAVLMAFAGTNYVSVGPYLGRELHGAPQGDALSSALLRLWKWHREVHSGVAKTAESVAIPSTKCKLLHLFGCNALVLDLSYRDDLRMFFAWNSSSGICHDVVQSWAWAQWRRRFVVGTMSLEEADTSVFTGLRVTWEYATVILQPCMPDPWAAYSYDEVDNFPLKPWQSWAPRHQFLTTVRGLLCRSWYFSTTRSALISTLWEVFVALVLRASYPWNFVRSAALSWARLWIPKGRFMPCPTLLDDVSNAIARFESSLSRL